MHAYRQRRPVMHPFGKARRAPVACCSAWPPHSPSAPAHMPKPGPRGRSRWWCPFRGRHHRHHRPPALEQSVAPAGPVGDRGKQERRRRHRSARRRCCARRPAATPLLGTPADQINAPLMLSRPPYDAARDFSPVGCVSRGPNVLVVNPLLPAHNVAELLRGARAAGADQLRQRGQQQYLPPVGRAVRADGRDRADAHSLSRQRAGHRGHHRRRCR